MIDDFDALRPFPMPSKLATLKMAVRYARIMADLRSRFPDLEKKSSPPPDDERTQQEKTGPAETS